MENLRARYSFTELQCKKIVDDAQTLVNDAVLQALGEIIPMVADNIANNIQTLLEQKEVVMNENNNEILVEETVMEDESLDLAIKFLNENSEFIKSQLIFRNQAYTNYVNTVATIDLYDDYLSENPIFVPRKFRNDNRHCLSKDERDVVDRISIQKLKGEAEFLQCRRDEFRKRIKNGDDTFTRFLRDRISDEDVLQEVMTAWNSSLRVDEEKVDELQIKKTENLKNAHQKDRLWLQSRNTPSGNQSSDTGTAASSAAPINSMDSASTTGRGNSINPITNGANGGVISTMNSASTTGRDTGVTSITNDANGGVINNMNSASTTVRGNRVTSNTNRANGGVRNQIPGSGSHQGMMNHHTPQIAGHTSPHEQQTKNENSHRKKKKTKRNPPHLASLTYLTSICNQRISAC